MKNHIFVFLLMTSLIVWNSSCINNNVGNEINKKVCNGEQGSFEFTVGSDTYNMEIDKEAYFGIAEFNPGTGTTTIDGGWYPTSMEVDAINVSAFFYTRLSVGNYSFEFSEENEDEFFGVTHTILDPTKVVLIIALNLSLDVSEAKICETVNLEYCPIRCSFSGEFERSITDSEGVLTKDTIPGYGSFCLYETF